jgi:hypothetical protein
VHRHAYLEKETRFGQPGFVSELLCPPLGPDYGATSLGLQSHGGVCGAGFDPCWSVITFETMIRTILLYPLRQSCVGPVLWSRLSHSIGIVYKATFRICTTMGNQGATT